MNIERLKNFLENKPTTIELKITIEDCLYLLQTIDVLINDNIQNNHENFGIYSIDNILRTVEDKIGISKKEIIELHRSGEDNIKKFIKEKIKNYIKELENVNI